MATAKEIEIPNFDFSGFYYPEILRSLIQYQRVNVPEITDESDEEPFQQLLRSYALVGHLNNVLLDIAANETLLPTARLLESIRGQLALIDVRLRQATPAQTDLVLELSKIFTVATLLVPKDSQFGTEETDENPQILYETNQGYTVDPTDKMSALYCFTAGKIKINTNSFDANDEISVAGIGFEVGVDWFAGGNIAASLVNLAAAINSSANDAIKGRIAAIHDGIDTISLIPLAQDVESIPVAQVDGVTDNFDIQSGGFGVNKSGFADTEAVFFDLFDSAPKQGDMIYFGHTSIMWDTLEFTLNLAAAGLSLVWEFYDATQEDAKPDLVTNLGSNLELDLTTMLGALDRRNTVVRVVLSSTGASETCISQFVGGKNIVRTVGLLGQAIVTIDPEAYIVGCVWNEVFNTVDGTSELTQEGKVEFTLPQNVSQNWLKTVVNGLEGFWLRARVVKTTGAVVNPSVDLINIDTGKQFLLIQAVQGQTVADAPLGSSNGAADQQFTLTFRPLIEGTLTLEVDEGGGFQPWSQKENFLNSTSASKDFVLEILGDDTANIIFGDGVRGKIPVPGVDNIRAIYRVGADQDGNVGARTIIVNKSGISFINQILNPRQAQGWEAKEGSTEADKARLKVEGPATLRTRNRAISIPDFEFLAVQFLDSLGSQPVNRALAIEETYGVKTIELVVVGKSGALLTEAVREEITNYFNGNKALGIEPVILSNHEVTVVNYTPRIINVVATVTGGNAEQIKNAITALLNPDATFNDGVTRRWAFGQEIPISVIIAEVFEVDPVNIKKVVITTPGADVVLAPRELPLAGTVTVTVI